MSGWLLVGSGWGVSPSESLSVHVAKYGLLQIMVMFTRYILFKQVLGGFVIFPPREQRTQWDQLKRWVYLGFPSQVFMQGWLALLLWVYVAAVYMAGTHDRDLLILHGGQERDLRRGRVPYILNDLNYFHSIILLTLPPPLKSATADNQAFVYKLFISVCTYRHT